jgi:hypothetical protein
MALGMMTGHRRGCDGTCTGLRGSSEGSPSLIEDPPSRPANALIIYIVAVHSKARRGYAALGTGVWACHHFEWAQSKPYDSGVTSLWFHGVGVVVFVIGMYREVAAIRQGRRHLLAHALRILAYMLMASFFFFMAASVLRDANPPHRFIALSGILILGPVCIFILTGRAAVLDRPGRHAHRDQESGTR